MSHRTMEEQLLPLKTNAKRILNAVTPKFASSTIRNFMIGSIINTIMLDVLAASLITQSIRAGQFPWFTGDVMIITIMTLEAVATFLFSGAFQLKRRTVILLCLLASLTVAIGLPPFVSNVSWRGPEMCGTTISVVDHLDSGVLKLVVICIVCVVNAIARAGFWSHGVAFMDELKMKTMSNNYGVLIGVRVIALLTAPKFVRADAGVWIGVIPIIIITLLHIPQLYRVQEHFPPGKQASECATYGSVGRILSSPLVIGQLLGMAFLATALWGFGYYEREIIKTNYLIEEPVDILSYLYMFGYVKATFICIALVGVFFKTEIFNRAAATKQAFMMSLVATIMYCILAYVLHCNQGNIAGVGQTDSNFTQPACSSHCGCASPSSRFEPVCVTDSATTYLSACHAGCITKESIANVEVYRNCACAPIQGMQSALPGACGKEDCFSKYRLHVVFFAFTFVSTIIGLQAQAMNIIRSVRLQDRSVAIGTTAAIVITFSFCLGHIGYTSIAAATCSWADFSGACIFHNSSFPMYIGSFSVSLAGASALINFITVFFLKRKQNQAREDKSEGNGVNLVFVPYSPNEEESMLPSRAVSRNEQQSMLPQREVSHNEQLSMLPQREVSTDA